MVRLNDLNSLYDPAVKIVHRIRYHLFELRDLSRASSILLIEVDKRPARRWDDVAYQQEHHFVVPVIVCLTESLMVKLSFGDNNTTET